MAKARFSARLRLYTMAAHRRAEAPLHALLRARLPITASAAAAWLLAEALRHAAIERAHRRRAAPAALLPPALRLAGPLQVRRAQAPPADAAGAATARRLAAQFQARLARGRGPESFALHLYIVGLAHLYGGKVLAVLVSRATGAAASPDVATLGLADAIRGVMDSVARTPETRARILREAMWAYAHGGQVLRLLVRGDR
jgi:hypothetical protein